MLVVRRAAGCLLGLLLLPLAVATALSGYFLEERLFAGRWGGALAWCVATVVFAAVSLSVTGFARQLLGRDDPKALPTDQSNEGVRG